MKTNYIQTNDNAFSAQTITFKQEIGSYVSVLKLTPDQVSEQAADADYFEYCLKCMDILQKAATQATAWKDIERDGGTPPPTGAPVAPALSTPAVAKRRDDNSPAFQCRVKSANVPSPAGTTGNTKPKIRVSVQPSRWDLWPCASTPALKRRAIIGLSRWDVSPLMIPAEEKFEPAHVGCYRSEIED